MKNIIFLTQLSLWSMDNNKGAPSFFKTIQAYVNNDWNVTLIHPDFKNQHHKIEKIKSITFTPVFFPLVKIKKIGLLGRVLHSVYGSFKLYQIGKKILKKCDSDTVIYAYEIHGVKAGIKLKNKFNVPLVTRFQGTVLTDMDNTLINRLKKYPHFQAFGTKADLVIMTNDGTKGLEVLKRLNNKTEKILFYRNGVDIKSQSSIDSSKILSIKAKLALKPEDDILVTVSRLAFWKRVDRAINAFAQVVKQRQNCKLIIVGDGAEKNNLEKLSKKLHISEYVIFAGAVLQSQVKEYMEIADVFLSLYDLSNLGNPLFEAMSCGKPIITLDVGDTNTVIKNNINGILLKTEEIEKLPEYIIKVLDNKNLSSQLGNNAKEFAEREFWSWDQRMNAEIKEVNELLSLKLL